MSDKFKLNKKLEELELLPESVYKNLQKGKVFLELEKEQDAILCFENVIVEEPSNIEALELLLKIYNNTYSKNFNTQKSGEIAERILNIDKTHPIALEIRPQAGQGELIIDSYNDEGILDIIHYVRRINYLGIITLFANVIILIGLIGFLMMPLFFRNQDNEIERTNGIPNNSDEIVVNPLSDMDGYSKKDIFDLRKWYLFRSIFSNSEYSPSEEVFGGIRDGKYWYGTKHFVCFNGKKGTTYRAEGDSFISMWINNPSYLIGVNTPYAYDIEDDDGYQVCTDKNMLFIPQSINYNKELNLITVTLKTDRVVTSAKNLYYMLIGVNARDLGYKWGYVFNSKNITFRNQEQNTSINRRLYQFRDFIAVCGLTPNCNHLCSVQHDIEFLFDSNSDAVIDLKLWKEAPASTLAQPDIYYRLILEYEDKN